jgi:predicted transcriptional regulator
MSEHAGESALSREELLRMTTDIVSAYLSQNRLRTGDMSQVIAIVFEALSGLSGQTEAPVAIEAQKPAVPVKRSIMPDYLICLEDGKKLKMLKRYLRTSFGLSPEDYRAKWGLPPDYPMVAPNYAIQRSDFAKKIGLGRGRGARA